MGGAFNPVHLGHLLIAETAREQFNLDQIIWVPTYQPPHKSTSLIDFLHCWEMVKQAIADHPHFAASDVDYRRGGISYAVMTLKDLQHLFPNADWYWIIGTDAFAQLPQWRESLTLIKHCTWLVAPRNAQPPHSLGERLTSQIASRGEQLRWQALEMPEIGISSSLIRNYCALGRSLRYLVPESVRAYIKKNQLYI